MKFRGIRSWLVLILTPNHFRFLQRSFPFLIPIHLNNNAWPSLVPQSSTEPSAIVTMYRYYTTDLET